MKPLSSFRPLQPPKTSLNDLVDEIFHQATNDVDAIASSMQGGDLTSDQIEVTPAQYQNYVREMWSASPEARSEMAQTMGPEDWLNEALDIVSPTLSKKNRATFFQLLEGGVKVEDATSIVQQMHEADLLMAHVNDPTWHPPYGMAPAEMPMPTPGMMSASPPPAPPPAAPPAPPMAPPAPAPMPPPPAPGG